MEMTYAINYLEEVVLRHIPKLNQVDRQRIKQAIEEKLSTNPIGFGKPLQYSLKGHRRLRVGDYRIVYRITTNPNWVTIIAIKHRKEIYKN